MDKKDMEAVADIEEIDEIELESSEEDDFRRCSNWELAAFSMNNSATNIINFVLMSYVSYYAAGMMGLGTVIVSSVITGSRIWDGITDPLVGFWMDRTDGKYGKFRPFMIGGNLIMQAMILLLFLTGQYIPENFAFLYFVAIYLVYIVGYTMQAATTRAGQSVMTTDPQQRPLFSTFDLLATQLIFAGGAIYVSNYLEPKYGGFTQPFFTEFVFTVSILSLILTIIGVIGIRKYDQTKYFGTDSDTTKRITFKQMFQILKDNRPLQMLVVAASTDKLGMTISNNSIVMVMLFGIVIGDFGIYGQMSGITMIPVLIMIFLLTRYTAKVGSKKGLVRLTWVNIFIYLTLMALLIFGDPSAIRLGSGNFMTIAFLIIWTLATGGRTVTGGLAIPMIPDVTDYELYNTGRYAPGVIATLFSFVDKLISSFSQTIIGVAVAAIGFVEVFPEASTPYSTEIFWVTIFLFFGMMLIGWVATLIAMKFYELDNDRMIEIQRELGRRRRESNE
jgi:Na+/melibiose symporter-like transporter